MNKPTIVLPDIHFPYEDRLTLSAVERYIAEVQPEEIIQLGDLLDFDQISKYNKAEPEALVRSLRQDYDRANAWLDRIVGVVPKAKITLLEGNHEFRIEKLLREFPQLRGAIDVPVQLRIEERARFQWIKSWSEGAIYCKGNAHFIHGRYLNKYHASKHAEVYGAPVFYGHTHDVMSYPKVLHGKDRAIVGQSLGCLCQYAQRYLMGAPTNWQQAFGVFFFRDDDSGYFHHYVARIFGHKFIGPNGKLYRPDRRVKNGNGYVERNCRA